MSIFAGIAAASLLLFSCGKYEEGPKLSLASKKARIANTWALEKEFMGSTDITSTYRATIESESYIMEKDGKYSWSQTTTAAYGGQTTTETGTWELINKKEDLRMLANASGAVADTVTIVRLKSGQLWYKKIYGTLTMEYHLITK